MTQEEKAKAYDKALNIAREILNHTSENYLCTHFTKKDIKDMYIRFFPELKESEDERIRKTLIENFKWFCGDFPETTRWGKDNNLLVKDILAWLEKQGEPQDKGEISDGYHTFNELYYYRMLYNAAFFNMLPKEWVHKSKRHNDGEECFGGGWFIVMANLPTGQISNHYELKDWDLFQIPEKEVADKWDGHTPQEAADRLYKYLLEKQDEQKPFDYENVNIQQKDFTSIEPKFKIGDWITDGKALLYVTNFEVDYGYELKGTDGKVFHFVSPDLVEEYYHLWTIQDAKDGDVLAEDTCIFIIKKLNPNHTAEIYCCLHDDGDFELNSNLYFDNTCTYPATKEQRNLLFQKMKEAGYEWDAEKRELKLLITNGGDIFESENCEQKPAWSEEDRTMAFTLMRDIDQMSYISEEGKNERIGWLNSLDEKFTSTESAWSEEDEKMINKLMAVVELYYVIDDDLDKQSCLSWLKSLKTRYTWKPSDEQMADLWNMLCECRPADHQLLQDIYYGLKKLREDKVWGK